MRDGQIIAYRFTDGAACCRRYSDRLPARHRAMGGRPNPNLCSAAVYRLTLGVAAALDHECPCSLL